MTLPYIRVRSNKAAPLRTLHNLPCLQIRNALFVIAKPLQDFGRVLSERGRRYRLPLGEVFEIDRAIYRFSPRLIGELDEDAIVDHLLVDYRLLACRDTAKRDRIVVEYFLPGCEWALPKPV